MHKNYYKIVKLLKSFKIMIAAPTCFGLHKPSTGSYSLCFAKVTVLLPDDGLCKPKHVGATIITLNDFNCLKIL